MRILQAASNNALRHSRAGNLAIRALWDADTGLLQIEVEDDGQGLPDDSRLDGRGMRNMRARADALQGRLDIESATGGTHVRLMLDMKKTATRGLPREVSDEPNRSKRDSVA